MDSEWLELKDAAPLMELAESTLRRMCNMGEVQGARLAPWGKRHKWQVHRSVVQQQKSSGTYAQLLEQWKQEQIKLRKVKQTTIDRLHFGHRAYWRYLAGDPKDWEYPGDERMPLEQVTIPNLRTALMNISGKPGAADNVFRSMTAFYDYLVREGIRPKVDPDILKGMKPPKNKRIRRTFIKNDEIFQQLIEENEKWARGRAFYDRFLTGALLKFARYTGMRNSEICNLEVPHVDFKDLVINVYRGKGDKDRRVGIKPELVGVLQEAISRRPESKYSHLFLQRNGKPLNRRCISERIGDLADRIGLDLTPHGCRRTFITDLLLEGHPVVKIQKLVGHNDLATTQLYDVSSDEDALDILRGKQEKAPAQKPLAANPEGPTLAY
jgi:integrase/recombinase XerD